MRNPDAPRLHGRDHRPVGWTDPSDPGGADPFNWLTPTNTVLPIAYSEMDQTSVGNIATGTTEALQFYNVGSGVSGDFYDPEAAEPPMYFNSSGDHGAVFDLLECGPGTYLMHLTVTFNVTGDPSTNTRLQVNTRNNKLFFAPMGRTFRAFAAGGSPLNTFQIYDDQERTLSTWCYFAVAATGPDSYTYTPGVGNGLGVGVDVINNSGGNLQVVVGGGTNPGGWTRAGSSIFCHRLSPWN